MGETTLDITGQVCPFAALSAKKALDRMKKGDTLVIRTDCGAAATDTIPEIARSQSLEMKSSRPGSGIWELTFHKN